MLSTSTVPYASYLPDPRTFLHAVDPRVKQLWLATIFVLLTRATPPMRLVICGVIAGISVAALPPRVWRTQIGSLLPLIAFALVTTALFADGVPPVLQARTPAPGVDGLAPLSTEGGYQYVLFHAWLVTVTRRSVTLAIALATTAFAGLLSTSLCLITTAPEQLALGFRWFVTPLRLLGVPVQRLTLVLLMSLRFVTIVFDDVRNLCLGLASRGINFKQLGGMGVLDVWLNLVVRLFSNLFNRSEQIAQAMAARGFVGPEAHRLYILKSATISPLISAAAVLLLCALGAGVFVFQ